MAKTLAEEVAEFHSGTWVYEITDSAPMGSEESNAWETMTYENSGVSCVLHKKSLISPVLTQTKYYMHVRFLGRFILDRKFTGVVDALAHLQYLLLGVRAGAGEFINEFS